jgi:hypothetical protein
MATIEATADIRVTGSRARFSRDLRRGGEKPTKALLLQVLFDLMGDARAKTPARGEGATMPRGTLLIARLLGALLVSACAPVSSGGDGQGGTSTSTSGASLSGSATSATDGSAGDSAPTTAALTASGTSSSTGISCEFLCEDIPADPCDSWAQDCPEGQKCTPVITDGNAWNTVACVDVIGSDEPGELCTMKDVASGVDSCVKGAMCWDVDEQGGYCVALCMGTPEAPVCETKTGPCLISGSGVLNLCLPSCDPLVQDCPRADEVCYANGFDFSCAEDASGDEGQANDVCEYLNLCDPGLWCGDPALVGAGCPDGSFGCCTPFCEYPGGACPNPDQQCVQWFDAMDLPANAPWLGIGYCGVPG